MKFKPISILFLMSHACSILSSDSSIRYEILLVKRSPIQTTKTVDSNYTTLQTILLNNGTKLEIRFDGKNISAYQTDGAKPGYKNIAYYPKTGALAVNVNECQETTILTIGEFKEFLSKKGPIDFRSKEEKK